MQLSRSPSALLGCAVLSATPCCTPEDSRQASAHDSVAVHPTPKARKNGQGKLSKYVSSGSPQEHQSSGPATYPAGVAFCVGASALVARLGTSSALGSAPTPARPACHAVQ